MEAGIITKEEYRQAWYILASNGLKTYLGTALDESVKLHIYPKPDGTAKVEVEMQDGISFEYPKSFRNDAHLSDKDFVSMVADKIERRLGKTVMYDLR